jgi:ribosome-associated toxin RatA of RatAB toxin-antitoxin module
VRILGSAALATVLLGSGVAHAEGLSAAETARLMRGEAVSRTQQIDRGRQHYVGGVTYEIVDAAPQDLSALVDDVASWRRFLPRTRDVQRVGEREGDSLVEMTHGSTLLEVAYTLRFHRDGNELRFWMDRTRRHDIDDAWGFLRAEPMADGRTLLTWGIMVDMGPGLLRDLFEPKVQALALAVPERVKDVVVERAARGQRAAR